VSEAGEDFYTVQEAAKILRTTERTVRRRLDRGDLEGSRDVTTGRWRVSARAVTAAMPDRPPKEPQEALEAYGEEAAELRERVEDLLLQLGRLEGRLELTVQTESTLREERDRLLAERDRERERADRLDEELRQAQAASYARRSWWSRLFGQ
jgi:excisionase family DNA binding protein